MVEAAGRFRNRAARRFARLEAGPQGEMGLYRRPFYFIAAQVV